MFFLASELGKTINELRSGMTDTELVFWAAFYEVKREEEKKAIDRK